MVGYIINFWNFSNKVMFWNVLKYLENRFKGALIKSYVAVTLIKTFQRQYQYLLITNKKFLTKKSYIQRTLSVK